MSDSVIENGKGGAAPLPVSYNISEVRDWIALLKPRVMSLVVFSAVAGLLVAPGHLHPVLAVIAILCIAVAAGASFYVLIYTMWLKRRTPQNIVIGGAAGAFPPVIGWAAVTGDITLVPIILFAIIFIWTPPHFWALSLWAHEDYAKAGVPMLPVTAGARETRKQILVYTLALAPLGMAPWFIGFSGPVYGAVAALLGLNFIRHAVLVLREAQDEAGRSLTGDKAAKKCFRFSLTYLFALFAVLAAEKLLLTP